MSTNIHFGVTDNAIIESTTSQPTALLDEKEVIEMVVNTINGGLKGSLDDESFTFFYVNDGLCNMLGYTKEEFMQMSRGTAVGACYPPDLANALSHVKKCFSIGPEYKTEYRMRKKDGSLIWVQDTGRKFIDKDGTTRINSILTDITSERQALENLEMERERYNFALDSINNVLFEYIPTDDLLITYTKTGENRAVQRIEHKQFLSNLSSGAIVDTLDCDAALDMCSGKLAGPIDLRVYDFVHTNRGLRIASARAKNIVDSDGNLRYVIGVLQDVTEQRQNEERLLREAAHDKLTGLLSYTNGRDAVEQYLSTDNASGALFIIDIDDFKKLNNQLGHVFSNAILVSIADKLSRTCLSTDILSRIGNDKFFLFLKGIEQADALIKGGRLLEAIQSVETGSAEVSLSCSIGITVASNKAASFDALFAGADKALSWVKSNGKGSVELFKSEQKYSDIPSEHHTYDDNLTSGKLGERQLINFALDIFDKTSNVQSAVRILIGIVGRTFNLQRVTVHQMGAPDCVWTDEKTQPFPCENWSVLLPKTDLYALVKAQDSTGTTIVQSSILDLYSPASHLLITQNRASTVLYAPIIGSGQHLGAVSYVSVDTPRAWAHEDRALLGEISRIIAARVVASRAVANVEKRLDSVVNYDTITGLVSFGRFKEEVARALRQNPDKEYVIYYIDIQQFKYINEQLGYSEGDNVLKDFAAFVREKSTRIAAITRAMADHFVVLIETDDIYEDFTIAASDIHDAFREKENKKYDINVMFRTGIYIIDDKSLDVSICIDRANSARKSIEHSQGSACVTYSAEIGRRLQFENELTSQMQAALENGEFCVYYQPKVRFPDYKLVGAEALVRWIKPDGTVISPINFIPLFEKNGFITKLDKYVVAKTIEQLRAWKDAGLDILPVSVNASAMHATERDHALYLLDLLHRYDIDAKYIEVELTESAIVGNSVEVENMLSEIRAIGVKTSIDDLGAGYSVLNMIMNMPIDIIKIDREFMVNCCMSTRGEQFFEQLVTMIKGLGYIVLCEGIETMEQARKISSMGCDLAQGFVFGRPMPAQKFEALLIAENS